MAHLVKDDLYRVALDGEHNFVYISAKDRMDLMRFLAKEYAGKHEVYAVKLVGKDGMLLTVPVITDETYQRLCQHYAPPRAEIPLSEFGTYLKELQTSSPYQWPNRYFAWEKPDHSIFMIGLHSTQMFHLLIHEQEPHEIPEHLKQEFHLLEPTEPEYKTKLYGIEPYASYYSGNVKYDPVEVLSSKVSEYKFLGTWDDPDILMDSPNTFSRQLACGRWELALSHIKAEKERPSLTARITDAEQRNQKSEGEGRPIPAQSR